MILILTKEKKVKGQYLALKLFSVLIIPLTSSRGFLSSKYSRDIFCLFASHLSSVGDDLALRNLASIVSKSPRDWKDLIG